MSVGRRRPRMCQQSFSNFAWKRITVKSLPVKKLRHYYSLAAVYTLLYYLHQPYPRTAVYGCAADVLSDWYPLYIIVCKHTILRRLYSVLFIFLTFRVFESHSKTTYPLPDSGLVTTFYISDNRVQIQF